MHGSAEIFWFTGLSAVGKTTLARAVQKRLQDTGHSVLSLDGDLVRNTINTHLGFTPTDIKANNASIVRLCKKFGADYDAILVPIISPYIESRLIAKDAISPHFHEIYITASHKTLRSRDPKGLYKKASSGELDNLIGFSSTNIYEPPKNPDLVINTTHETITQSTIRLYEYCCTHIQLHQDGPSL